MAKQKKDSGKRYTKEEIISIKNYIDKNGSFRTYEDGNQYAEIHLENTGKDRSGHALYMCAWRIENGEYDSYF
ncbi:hypothetical protein EI906_04785 [Campylobacter coli]|uniref:hypothetical protein n=1 Tax=Campylobacter TaxID=194 RepID=UPI00025802C5|nr:MULTISPECIES: hypothetical protein [Campylobacter]ASE86406.1 hypothetical protein A6J90_04630 [Campylobacter jejuni]AZU50452.1 hypothetical protein B1780_01680 [Campylobacter jejuni subsp. jejuni]EAB5322384.1 hypothetical protein [Campylobacter jejuni]EAC1235459.1 hypothetical protein [Campylobacter coli]EAH4523902.1 hypothetical protein [Campylobacter jejuni]